MGSLVGRARPDGRRRCSRPRGSEGRSALRPAPGRGCSRQCRLHQREEEGERLLARHPGTDEQAIRHDARVSPGSCRPWSPRRDRGCALVGEKEGTRSQTAAPGRSPRRGGSEPTARRDGVTATAAPEKRAAAADGLAERLQGMEGQRRAPPSARRARAPTRRWRRWCGRPRDGRSRCRRRPRIGAEQGGSRPPTQRRRPEGRCRARPGCSRSGRVAASSSRPRAALPPSTPSARAPARGGGAANPSKMGPRLAQGQREAVPDAGPESEAQCARTVGDRRRAGSGRPASVSAQYR